MMRVFNVHRASAHAPFFTSYFSNLNFIVLQDIATLTLLDEARNGDAVAVAKDVEVIIQTQGTDGVDLG